MPYADNDGVRIHYRVEGEGPAVVLQHGFTQCIDDWAEAGYVAALVPYFRVIRVDARGHGLSDKPHDAAAYPLQSRVNDVVAVLDAVGIERAHFWGYSMGGWIGFGMAQYAMPRVNRLVIGGQHPYARSFDANRVAFSKAIVEGIGVFVASQEEAHGADSSPALQGRWSNADLRAYLAASIDRSNLEGILSSMMLPCCLYAGEADPIFSKVKQAAEGIPNALFFSLPRLNHIQGFYRSQLVMPFVAGFLRAD
jgi:pimeloyl-ACP methyl ester carboxylesterase